MNFVIIMIIIKSMKVMMIITLYSNNTKCINNTNNINNIIISTTSLNTIIKLIHYCVFFIAYSMAKAAFIILTYTPFCISKF